MDGATTVPLEEAALQGQHQKYELGWTTLFYLAYLLIMAGYFYFFFK
jgi:hypothetical protein